ncbi:MAG TPA: hypothetical protein VG963_23215 [Polyangiaceae bacterium]|nr:hypothetical protein [Polyangiaceae bacterium]
MKRLNLLLASTGLLIGGAVSRHAQGAPARVNVSIDPKAHLASLSPIAIGANAAAWDSNIVDRELPGLLAKAHVRMARYPGGSTADNYHWLTNTPEDPNAGGTDPAANFDAYLSLLRKAHAQGMVTLNYGSGTIQEAADWLTYANGGGPKYQGPVPTYAGASPTGHRAGIRYWEMGNELYGDGTYGAKWELNHNPLGPAAYANAVVAYSAALKAVDPSVRVGVVLTAPGNWPDGQVSDLSPAPWNDTVLGIAAAAIDFVDVHWYPQGPGGESDPALLAAPQNGESTPVSFTPAIASMVSTLKEEIARYRGATAGDVEILLTETNSVSYNPGKQTTSLVNALFLADSLATWLENGVANVDWWTIHNSPFAGNADASLNGSLDYGDYGLLSRGLATSTTDVEPPAETPFPAYYGLEVLGRFTEHGQTFLAAKSSATLVSVHAIQTDRHGVNVLVINKDPSTSYDVSVSVKDARLFGVASISSYGPQNTEVQDSFKRVFGSPTVTVPPYSVTTLQLP